jgi:ribonucleoside-triphosphate reductase
MADARTILFTTKTCPNCKIAAKLLDDAGIEYEKLFVEEHKEMAQELGLKQVPALIVTDGENAEKFVNVVGVREFIARKGSKVNA